MLPFFCMTSTEASATDMQETGEFARQGGIHIVDEGLENLRAVGKGNDVVIGNDSRDEGAMPVRKEQRVASGFDAQLAVAMKAHADDEAVVLEEVAVEGAGNLGDTNGEEGRVDNEVSLVQTVAIGGAIVGFDMVVEGLGSQLGMEFTRLAIHARTVIVVDAIGDIAGLLDLRQEDASTDGMNTTGREVEDIARGDLMTCQHLGDGMVLYAFLIFFGGHLPTETGIEIATRLSIEDVPHLALAHLSMDSLCHLVVGMYLDAEVFLGIDELHQKGQLTMILVVDRLSQNLYGMLADDADEVATGILAIGDDAGTGGYGTDFPAFADGFITGGKSFVGAELTTAPNDGMEVGMEEERGHISLKFKV